MLKKIIFICIMSIILLFIFSTFILADDLAFEIEQNIYINNNYFPVWDLYNLNLPNLEKYMDGVKDESGEVFQNREKNYVMNIIDGKYSIGYFERFEQFIDCKKETAQFIVEYVRDKEDLSKLNYDINFNLFNQKLDGIFIKKEVLNSKNHKLKVDIIGKIINGVSLNKSKYKGEIFSENSTYFYNGIKNGVNSDMNEEISIRDVEFRGGGFSIGLDLNWQTTSSDIINFKMKDIISKIKWTDIYTISMSMNKGRLGFFDDDLGVNSTSNTNRWGYEDYNTNLIPEYDLSVKRDDHIIGLFYKKELFPYIYFKIIEMPFLLKAGYFREFIYGEINYKNLFLNISTKNLDLFTSNGLGINFGFKLEF